MAELKSIPLQSRHEDAGAKLVGFGGFLMPLQYTGIKDEHHAVRTRVGLFDVSHMGEVELRGPRALDAADRLFTNDIRALDDGQAMYTAMCNEAGGIVDDLVVYRLADDRVFICVNAANRAKDFAHMQSVLADWDDLELVNLSDDWAQLAVQGPNALALVQTIAGESVEEVKYYRARFQEVAGVEGVLFSRTGYTGEDGFELYIPAADAVTIFDALIEAGDEFGLQLCGLGCRDTLRLEAKYLLYGSDMDENTNPVEAGLSWVVKLDRDANFVGRQAIESVKATGPDRRIRGFVLEGRGVLRPGYDVLDPENGQKIGHLTSGSYSPTLEESIGLGYVDADHLDKETVHVDIRGRGVEARVTRKPFYKRS